MRRIPDRYAFTTTQPHKYAHSGQSIEAENSRRSMPHAGRHQNFKRGELRSLKTKLRLRAIMEGSYIGVL
jgi:hypothetical protein